jgi:type I restriction enzyme S subunit
MRAGELVFARTGASVGKSYLYDPRDGELVYAGFLINVAPDPTRLNPKYLFLFAQSKDYWDWIARTSVRSGQPGVNSQEYAQLPIPVPDIAVQNAISDAITDVDDLISALERKMAKKQAIMRGMMQQLLTGRTRLSGFDGAWKTVTYRDLVRIERGEAFKAGSTAPGPVPVIAAGRSPAAFTDRSNRTAPVVTISGSGASAGYVAYHTVPIFASDCSTISPNPRVDLRFIYYSLLLRQDRIYQAQVGGAQPHVHAKDVYPLAVEVPPLLHEQRAIAQVLEDVDAEIAALRQRLGKARSIKVGMMQELLTGRTRLPVKEAVA